jgi:hypothetical protein
MNSSRSSTLAALLLSTLLALPAAAAWAVPSITLPAGTGSPQPYQGQHCHAGGANQEPTQEKEVSFDQRNSPCRLEDASTDKDSRINGGQEDPADTLKKVEDWDGVNRHPQADEQAPELLRPAYKHGVEPEGGKHHSMDLPMAPVPEPASWAMLLGGVAVLALRARLRRRA